MMVNEPRNSSVILGERLETIQKISQATAEHLRLTQSHAGLMILDLKQDETSGVPQQLDSAQNALANREAELDALQVELARLDAELETLAGEQKT